jgi:hypothetical protein
MRIGGSMSRRIVVLVVALGAVPYAFAALEGNATPVGALVALPIAAVATLGNNSRYNVAHERAYG